MRGQYRIWLPDKKEIVIPNTIVDNGEEAMLRSLFRDDNSLWVAGAANMYVGFCNQTPSETDILASITTEPTAAGGYARQPIPRSAVGWPTLTTVGGEKVIISQTLTFTAAGADFSGPFSRVFLCDVVAGAVGNLWSYSGALTTPVTVLNGQSVDVQYEFYLN